MAQMNKRSAPQHYQIVGSVSKTVFATASYSKVMQVACKLQAQYDEKLDIVLIEEE